MAPFKGPNQNNFSHNFLRPFRNLYLPVKYRDGFKARRDSHLVLCDALTSRKTRRKTVAALSCVSPRVHDLGTH